MSKIPNHFHSMDPEYLKKLQTPLSGLRRFWLGFADPGEILGENEFIGNFRTKKEAEEAQKKTNGIIHPYLYGRFDKGWAVWTNTRRRTAIEADSTE